ncbi:hypothetical protein GCM10010430_70750 [Kitasatospora cystarginea]|uniref:DUF317 domain-containing protein n=1 Tax=Kitasatospora cystarginea TaxID=58350 RepID=A0ABN3EX91_9ACTN
MSDITFGTFGTTVVAIGARPERRPEAAKALEKAGFAYQPAVGFHELPVGTHPLDAMVRIEYAADLLAASGIGGLGIDPYLTSVFERQAREHPALARTGHAHAQPGPLAPAPTVARPARRPHIPADPDTAIDITPTYLAGREHTDRVFDRLVEQWAWGRSTSHELGQTFAWSPDHRFRLGDGQLDPGARWRIAAAKEPLGPPEWQAAFSEEVPPEIIMAVTEELARTGSSTDWTGEAHPALQTPADRQALIRTLRDAGWRSTYKQGVLDLEAPDELARVQVRLDPPGDPLDLMAHPHLYVEIGPRGNGGYPPYWQAMFTTAAPAVIVDALARALTDPAPLKRDRDWMDEDLLAHLGQGLEDEPAPAETHNEDQTVDHAANSSADGTTRAAAARARTVTAAPRQEACGGAEGPEPGGPHPRGR